MNIQLWRTISVVVLLLHIIYTAISYSTLPDIIPTHFNAAGEADAWGSKNSIWFMPIMNIAIFAMFLGINFWLAQGSLKNKWGLNIPEEWKEDPTGEIQKLVVVMMEAFNIYTTLLLFLVSFSTVYAAKGNDAQLLILMVLIGGIFPPLIILGILMARASAIHRKSAPKSAPK